MAVEIEKRDPMRGHSLTTGQWSESSRKVLRERYLWKKGDIFLEDEDGCFLRVASAVAGAEESEESQEFWTQKFFNLMVSRKFMPNSPTIMNAGKGNGLQLSACFVLPVEDSIDGIFDSIKHAAIIHKSGGGTGFSFSRLRPKGSTVGTSQGVASGPVSFMRIFDAATEQIKQGGTRRGANMGILRVDHPDILEFIECKLTGGITNFNISVAITDEFVDALQRKSRYYLRDPQDRSKYVGELDAQEVFNKICEAAWRSGDPGLIFIDRINGSAANPTPEVWEIEATNPCGEQPLAPYEACNLGSINLERFITVDETGFDWNALKDAVATAVRFLDNVIEINPYPLPEIHRNVKANRRIGLGVMGWADALFVLGIPYGSKRSLELAHRVMKFIEHHAHEASENLAIERGPFPNFPRSIYKNSTPIRNSTVTTIAPTGTISIIADCSSGIEPIFALAFTHMANGRILQFVNPVFESRMKILGYWNDDLENYVKKHGSIHNYDKLPQEIRDVFVTSHEIEPELHVKMQAAFQRYTDNAVSKTINLPNEASVEDVANAYLTAWETGCLGITVFRDGCKGAQVLNVGLKEKEEERPDPQSQGSPELPPEEVGLRPRPAVVTGYTRHVKAPEGTLNVTINSDDDGPMEVFINVGKAGSDIAGLAEALGRLISLTLRLPSPMTPEERLREIADQLRGIGGSRVVGFGANQVRSLPDAVAKAIDYHTKQGQDEIQIEEKKVVGLNGRPLGNLCPGCGSTTLVYQEGCRKCILCGHSEC